MVGTPRRGQPRHAWVFPLWTPSVLSRVSETGSDDSFFSTSALGNTKRNGLELWGLEHALARFLFLFLFLFFLPDVYY